MTKYLQESRMREIHTFGSTRGSNGLGKPRPLLSTLLSISGGKQNANQAPQTTADAAPECHDRVRMGYLFPAANDQQGNREEAEADHKD